MIVDERMLADEYYRDALQALTGVAPPPNFTMRPLSDAEEYTQQEWAVNNVRPRWACGISLLEAARAFVDDARGNGNILKERASDPAPFELIARGDRLTVQSKPPTKRQLWRRVTRLAGELIVGNGLQSNYLLPTANLFNSDDPAENIRGLIKHARYLGDCARLIAKLEAALAAYEAAP